MATKTNFFGRLWNGQQTQTKGKGAQKQGAEDIDWGNVGSTAVNVTSMLADPIMTYAQQAAKKKSIRKRADILRGVPKSELPGVVSNIRGPQGLTYEQKEAQKTDIAGIRNQYGGSDATMQMIGKNMAGAQRYKAKNTLASQDAALYRQDQDRYDQAQNRFNQQKYQRDASQAEITNRYNTEKALVDSGEQRELQGVRDETMDYGRSVLDSAAKYGAAQDAMEQKNAIRTATDKLRYARQFQIDNPYSTSGPSVADAEAELAALTTGDSTKNYWQTRGGAFSGIFKK